MAASPDSVRNWKARFVALYVGSILLFGAAVSRSWHPIYGFTALIQFTHPQSALIPPLRSLPLFLNPPHNSYDGVMYSQLAYDPLLRNPEQFRGAIDNLPYRARRSLLSWLAWLFAGGDPARIVYVYPYLNFAFWLGLAALLWRWFPPTKWHHTIAFFGVLYSAGALQSVRFALTDLPALTFAAAGLALAERGRVFCGAWGLAFAALSRETALGSAPAFVWPRERCARAYAKTAVTALIVLGPVALWTWYVGAHAGSLNSGTQNFAAPLVEYFAKWRESLSNWSVLPWLHFASLAALVAVTVQVLWMGTHWQWRNVYWRFGAPFVLLFLVLGEPVWDGFPGAAYRVLLPLQLAFALCVPKTRTGFVVLCLGSLTVFSAIDPWRVPLVMSDEFCVYSKNGDIFWALAGEGWYDRDLAAKRIWAKGDAQVSMQMYRGGPAVADLGIDLISVADRDVHIAYRGKELWHGHVGRKREHVELKSVPIGVRPEWLSFTTDVAATPPPTGGDPRALAFAVVDFEVDRLAPAGK